MQYVHVVTNIFSRQVEPSEEVEQTTINDWAISTTQDSAVERVERWCAVNGARVEWTTREDHIAIGHARGIERSWEVGSFFVHRRPVTD